MDIKFNGMPSPAKVYSFYPAQIPLSPVKATSEVYQIRVFLNDRDVLLEWTQKVLFNKVISQMNNIWWKI